VGADHVRDAYAAAAQQYIELFGEVAPDDPDAALIRRYLGALTGPVLDLGCGPGQWTAHLHAYGADVTGVDLVPAFVAHARRAHPGPTFRLGSMLDLDAEDGSVAGLLAWYSLIHLAPEEVPRALAGFRRLLAPSGVLVLGFFDSDDTLASFEHKVVNAYRWPVDVLAEQLVRAGFTEVHRRQQRVAERPDRRYATVVALATS
jgi:SAM-dependent methyltransferase